MDGNTILYLIAIFGIIVVALVAMSHNRERIVSKAISELGNSLRILAKRL